MPRLSVVLIVKNEEQVLASCLEKLLWADEIIVLDSGSTDKTLDIAKQFTSHVYVDTDWQGFGVQRQRAQSRATGEWILMVDADEHVTDELRQEIQQVVREDDQDKVYEIPRLAWCFGGYIRHSGWYPGYTLRLYPNKVARYGDQRVHEKLEYPKSVRVERLAGDLIHYTYWDLNQYLTKSTRYASEWAEQHYLAGKKASLLNGVSHGVYCFLRMYILRAGFLDGKRGFLLALLSTFSTFAKYADLWVRWQLQTKE
ncbi:MAG: glycosyltransferase [Gammaproteobacteria bacterium]|nr:glycosyltransferase [Gammaproteobacteria bacterium]